MNSVLYSSKSNNWETPDRLFLELDKEFSFTLDPCCTPTNAKCKKYYTQKQDGLIQSWQGETVFCNPPYGKEIKLWVEKCYIESKKNNAKVVLLIPARTDTKYFHSFIYNKAQIRFIKGRLRFSNSKNSAPFPSMIVIF